MSQLQSKFIKECISQFNNDKIPYDYIYSYPALLPFSTNKLTLEECFLCRVLIWDVQKLFPNLTLNCPTCADRGSVQQLTSTRWKSGDGAARDKPRILYDSTGLVQLVSRVYYCKNQHEFVAHDELILRQSRLHITEPFVLFHKSGLTRNLYNMIESHDAAGLSVSDTMKVWSQMICINYQGIRDIFCARTESFNKEDFPTDYLDIFGGRKGQKLITAVLNTTYFLKEKYYDNRMSCIDATAISCDHTFKVPVNIGLWVCQKWVKIYKSLFIVLNETGLVVGWQLCRNSKFESVENLLQRLFTRFEKSERTLVFIHIDNCCTWRALLKGIFGEHIQVKLDWFHGIQRVTSEVPRKKGVTEEMKSLRRKMIANLKMVVRQPHDYGSQRKSSTADEVSMERNINEFLKIWRDQEIDGSLVLPQSALKAIDGLLIHVRSGCLSNIPPSGGTNRNEAIHRPINKAFKGQRFGVQTAIASLGKFFYRWNERKQSMIKNIVLPIDFHSIKDENDEFFGTEQRQEPFKKGSYICEDDQPPQPCHYLSSEKGESSEEENEDDTASADEDENRINIAMDIHKRCLEKLQIVEALDETMKGMVLSDVGSVFHPFSIFSLFLATDSRSTLERQIFAEELHERCTLKKHCSPESTNSMSFFFSMVCALEHLLSDSTEEEKNFYEVLGLSSHNRYEKMSGLIALALEDFNKNELFYRQFVSEEKDFKEELKTFEDNMAMESPFCKLLFLAAAEVLRLPIVMMTDLEHFPLLVIFPRSSCIVKRPLLIQIQNDLNGSFKVSHLLPKKGDVCSNNDSTSAIKSLTSSNDGCRCGMGANKHKIGAISCNTTRCKCFFFNRKMFRALQLPALLQSLRKETRRQSWEGR